MGEFPIAALGPVGFRAPRYRPYLWQVIWGSAGVALGLFYSSGTTSLWLYLAAEATHVCLLTTYLLGRTYMVRRRGGPPPITFTAEEIQLPADLLSTRTSRVALVKLRSASVVGVSRRARLVIDAGWRRYAFPLDSFTDSDAVDRV